ncbi:MAG TPA: hypothetical protein VFU15_16230 [Bacteroidia bacterium]|nr:hypothetical protein [Bacteroidia bacterium]
MDKKQISELILRNYYHTGGRTVRLTLADGSVHDGMFAGYYHDDIDDGENPPDRWHFVTEKEFTDFSGAAGNRENFGIIIRTEEIVSVQFKT